MLEMPFYFFLFTHTAGKAFTSRQFGVGQAEALILFIIVAVISGVQVYMTKKQEVEA